MATTEAKGDERTIVASWVPRTLADQLKRCAEAERRSVSQVIRHALEHQLGAEDRRS